MSFTSRLTDTRSPTRSSPHPSGSPLHPTHGFRLFAASTPTRILSSGLYGTALSLVPSSGLTFGSLKRLGMDYSRTVGRWPHTRHREHLDTKRKSCGSVEVSPILISSQRSSAKGPAPWRTTLGLNLAKASDEVAQYGVELRWNARSHKWLTVTNHRPGRLVGW